MNINEIESHELDRRGWSYIQSSMFRDLYRHVYRNCWKYSDNRLFTTLFPDLYEDGWLHSTSLDPDLESKHLGNPTYQQMLNKLYVETSPFTLK